MQNNKTSCSIGLLLAVALVIFLLFAFKNLFWWFLGIILFITVVAITFLLIYSLKEKRKKQRIVIDGITAGNVDAYISKSLLRLQAIRRNYYKLRDDEMRKELNLISDRFKQITKIVKEDPKDFKVARRFINMLLSSLDKIVGQSVQLFESPEINDAGKKSLANAKEGLILLRKSANTQINRLYENNILELDVEIEVLKKTLAARGLLEDESGNNSSMDMKGESYE